MNARSATERCNALIDSFQLDRASRSAEYGLIRLTLVNICQHAMAQHDERLKEIPQHQLLDQTLHKIRGSYREPYLDTG